MKHFIQEKIRSYTAVETFHSELERLERMKELRRTDNTMTFRTKIEFDIQDCFLLEYTICTNS